MAIKNISIDILFIPCIILRLKEWGASGFDLRQKTMYDRNFLIIITEAKVNKCDGFLYRQYLGWF